MDEDTRPFGFSKAANFPVMSSDGSLSKEPQVVGGGDPAFKSVDLEDVVSSLL